MANGDNENPRMSETDGSLYIGCGLGSWANEHYSKEKDRSACYLVARELGLDPRRYKDLVSEVTREDRYGVGEVKDHISQVIKDLYDMGWDFFRVYAWVKTALVVLSDTKSKTQFTMSTEACSHLIENKFGKDQANEWFSVATKAKLWGHGEFVKACAYINKNMHHLFHDVETYRGTLKICVLPEIQKNHRIGAAARSRGADLVLMRGQLDFNQVGITLQQKPGTQISFSKVLEELRKHELMHQGVLTEKKLLRCKGEGTVSVCPVWHGHQAATGQNTCFAIYNRSKSRPCGPGSVLDFEYIKDLILNTLEQVPEGEVVSGLGKFLEGGSDLNRAFERNKKPDTN